MYIVVDKTSKIVRYAGPSDCTSNIGNWCVEHTVTNYDVISVSSVPLGYLDGCWMYNSGVWSIVPASYQKVYDQIARTVETEPVLTEANIISGSDLSIDGTVTAWFDIFWNSVQTATAYELRYRVSGDSIWSLVSLADSGTGKTSLRISGLLPSRTYEFCLRASCLWGMSAWTGTVTKPSSSSNIFPDDVQTFFITTQQDGTRQFSWIIPDFTLSGYKIRYINGMDESWDSMTPLHTGLLSSSPYETNQLPAGVYTFGIVGVNNFGKESLNPKFAMVTLDEPRLSDVWASSVSVGSNWPGEKTDCHITTQGLEVDDQSTWDSVPTWDAWDAWCYDPKPSMSYITPVIDIGSPVSFVPVLNCYGLGTMTKQMSTSADNITWSDFVDVAPASARYVKFKATVTTVEGLVSLLMEVSAYIIVRGKTESLTNLNTATLTGQYRLGVGDIRLPIALDYGVISNVNVVIQNLATCSYSVVVDKDTVIGPRIRILDGFSAADAIIDVVVTGT